MLSAHVSHSATSRSARHVIAVPVDFRAWIPAADRTLAESTEVADIADDRLAREVERRQPALISADRFPFFAVD
jgi:hypothetical protein